MGLLQKLDTSAELCLRCHMGTPCCNRTLISPARDDLASWLVIGSWPTRRTPVKTIERRYEHMRDEQRGPGEARPIGELLNEYLRELREGYGQDSPQGHDDSVLVHRVR